MSMGFFGNARNIGLINDRLKRMESLMDEIAYKMDSPYKDKTELQRKMEHVKMLGDEIIDICSESGRSVMLAPYWFKGRKSNLNEILSMVKMGLDVFQHNL